MKLNQIRENEGATRNSKRVGRGVGSGRGKTSGSGHKGQKARSGVSINGFEGGQLSINRCLPKRGFNNIFRKNYVELYLGRIQTALDDGKLAKKAAITADVFVAAGVNRRERDGVRILAKGTLKDKVEIHASGASKAAQEAVAASGGSIVLSQPAGTSE